MKKIAGLLLFLAFAAPLPGHASASFVPDGTYAYAISMHGKPVGSTQVVVHRSSDGDRIVIGESGSYQGLVLRTQGSLQQSDLLPVAWESAGAENTIMAGFLALPSIVTLHGLDLKPDAPAAAPFWKHVFGETLRPIFPKTALDEWPDDVGLAGDDFTLFYDAQTKIVHVATFPKAGMTLRLTSGPGSLP